MRTVIASAVLLLTLLFSPAWAVDYEHPPISYSQSTPANRVTKLQDRLSKGEAKLRFQEPAGYLASVLEQLDVPVSSQVLVFSQTSMQRNLISPQQPRAIYFNDELAVGYVPPGVIEIAAADPNLGTVFYTLPQQPAEPPVITRETNRCLTCHSTTRTRHVPGFQVRSVFVDPLGQPILAAGSYLTNHASPLAERWGGWYVTGTHGDQKHLGNLVLPTSKKPKSIDNSAGQNQTDLKERFDSAKYLSPHSDLVALMVLEHQADGYNLLARASFETRLALHSTGLSPDDFKSFGELPQAVRDRITAEGEPLLRYLLFSGEATLTAPLRGTSAFAKEFSARGPHDSHGRSLRDLDLQRRLFAFPCGYLVYSPVCRALPTPLKSYLARRFQEILTGQDASPEFAHLSNQDRRAILEILEATNPTILHE